MSQWWLLVCCVLLGIVSLLTTCVFCFWFVYLLTSTRSKLKFYRNALKCLQQGDNDFQQLLIVHNTKTQLVMNIFMFCINLVDWLAFIFARVAYMIDFIEEYQYEESGTLQFDNSTQQHFYVLLLMTSGERLLILPLTYNLLILANSCLVLGLILVASLCMYLAARYAQISWIKSTSIPYLIFSFLLCLVVTQILALFCSTSILANWFSIILLTVSLIIALKQYKKLSMVINWTIVDLKVSQNTFLLIKQTKMKQTFTKIFSYIWIGTVLIIFSEYTGVVMHTFLIVVHNVNSSSFHLSLCENSQFSLEVINDIFTVLYFTKFTLGVLGAAFIFIPYLGYGYSTMYISLWRQFNCKAHYKTRYHNPLDTPLIRTE